MKKRTPDHFPSVAGNVEPVAQDKAASCNAQHMLIDRHSAMLYILFCPAKISGCQYIRRILFNLPLNDSIALQLPFPLFRLPLCTRSASFSSHRSPFRIHPSFIVNQSPFLLPQKFLLRGHLSAFHRRQGIYLIIITYNGVSCVDILINNCRSLQG